jgi:hypothetical protein
MTLAPVAIVLPVIAGIILAARLSAPPRLEELAVACAGAIGAASVIWSALLFLRIPSSSVLSALDLGIWLAIVVGVWTIPTRTRAGVELIRSRERGWIPILLLISVAIVAVVSFTAAAAVAPHGEWDAWAQWNLRARFLFRGFPDEWRNAFAPVLSWSHPDYPLLVPASVARVWMHLGRDRSVAPILLSGGFALLTVVAVGGSVARLHGRDRGCLAAAAILACPSFVRYAAAQCADIPAGLYMLIAFIALDRAAAGEDGRWWILAGGAAALAAWTKNEGIAFFCAFTIASCVVMLRTNRTGAYRAAALFLCGATPALLMLILFKLVLAPPSYFTAEQSIGGALAGLLEPRRVSLVVEALANELWFTGAKVVGVLPAMGALLLIGGVRRPIDPAPRMVWPVIAAMMLAYAVAYLVSPKDLAWQLRTSVDRVVVQVVPTIIWASMKMAADADSRG